MLPTRHVVLSLIIGWFLICGLCDRATTAQEVLAPVAVAPAGETTAPLHNIRLAVSEKFLNHLVARDDLLPGDVRDRFGKTQIVGRQTTATHLRVDIQPSQKEGRVLVTLEGNTNSSTSGFSPHAVVVQSVGHQYFRGTKEILFDGNQLTTRHAVLSVQAENKNVGAVTRLTCTPLGPLAEKAVLGAARFRQTDAQAFARQRVIERVYPKFETEIDAQLANGNKLLKETLPLLQKNPRLVPKDVRVHSTDTQLILAASVAVPANLATLPPLPDRLAGEHGISFYLHDSLLQGVIEGSELGGQKITTGVLSQVLRLGGFTVEEPEFEHPDDEHVEIEFADADPLVVSFGEDETRITLRARFTPTGQDQSPSFEVTIPLRLEKEDDKWILKTGPVEASRLSHHTDKKSIGEVVVKKKIESRLPKISFPQQIPASRWPAGKTPPTITSIRSSQGWLAIGID